MMTQACSLLVSEGLRMNAWDLLGCFRVFFETLHIAACSFQPCMAVSQELSREQVPMYAPLAALVLPDPLA